MRIIYLCLTLSCFFISCSDTTMEEFSSIDLKLASKEMEELLPDNASNPYDAVGTIHNDVIAAYFDQDTLPSTLSDVIAKVKALALEDATFKAYDSTYSFVSNERVGYLIAHADSTQVAIINTTLSSSESRTSLIEFVSDYFVLCDSEDDFGTIYYFIVAYESGILNSTTISATDKKVILMTTSIARHSAYVKKKKPKKNKDPEWDYLVTNIIAATDGGSISEQEAVMRAVIVGIASNEL